MLSQFSGSARDCMRTLLCHCKTIWAAHYLPTLLCSALNKILASLGGTISGSEGSGQDPTHAQSSAKAQPRVALGIDSLTMLMFHQPTHQVHNRRLAPAINVPHHKPAGTQPGAMIQES